MRPSIEIWGCRSIDDRAPLIPLGSLKNVVILPRNGGHLPRRSSLLHSCMEEAMLGHQSIAVTTNPLGY